MKHPYTRSLTQVCSEKVVIPLKAIGYILNKKVRINVLCHQCTCGYDNMPMEIIHTETQRKKIMGEKHQKIYGTLIKQLDRKYIRIYKI